MSVIAQFRDAMAARWAAKGYGAIPLIYGYREVARSKSIDAVLLGNGRIVYHAGAYPGPQSNAGQMSNEHAHPYMTGRAFGSDAVLFTAHLHGFDPAFPDPTGPGGECAHDDRCWALKEVFFSVAKFVQLTGPWKGFQYSSALWIRDPEQRRLGELMRCEFSFSVSMREGPEVPFEYPTPLPQGAVVGQSGNETIVVETE